MFRREHLLRVSYIFCEVLYQMHRGGYVTLLVIVRDWASGDSGAECLYYYYTDNKFDACSDDEDLCEPRPMP